LELVSHQGIRNAYGLPENQSWPAVVYVYGQWG
jgi:hypothetical protein